MGGLMTYIMQQLCDAPNTKWEIGMNAMEMFVVTYIEPGPNTIMWSWWGWTEIEILDNLKKYPEGMVV
jgi:hypothetical protein